MTEKSIDALTERVQRALSAPGCERLAEWAAIGPVQRAAVEQFAQSLVQPDVDAPPSSLLMYVCEEEWDEIAVTLARDSKSGHSPDLDAMQCSVLMDLIAFYRVNAMKGAA